MQCGPKPPQVTAFTKQTKKDTFSSWEFSYLQTQEERRRSTFSTLNVRFHEVRGAASARGLIRWIIYNTENKRKFKMPPEHH